jgi:acyl-CoA synthetase (AMP-forming)/AMP-acid ligase II
MYPGEFARSDPDRAALIMSGSGEVVTYARLDEAANRISHVLRDLGLKPGDNVAMCIENHPLFLELLWGAHYAGLLYTAASTRLSGPELGYIVDDCDARVLVLSARYADKAPGLDAATPNVEHRLSVGGAIPGYEALEDLMAAASPEPLDEERKAGADMLYSSGTTGVPKGIKPSLAGEAMETTPMLITGVLQRMMDFQEGDVYLTPAPLYHKAPLAFTLSVGQLGGTVIMMERFDAEETLRLIERHRITHGQLVPTMFVRMLRLPSEARNAHDISTLKGVVHAGAPCAQEVKQQMIDWWGPIIHEYYGGTEGNGVTWVTSPEWVEHPGSVGRAVIGTAHILDEDGSELGPDETGGVYFSDGPRFEYHKDPEKTRTAYDSRGWSTMGDIGHVDAEGYLYLTDRKSFTIITGGVNVYPQEAEDVLAADPRVADAAVFGIPNPEWGEEVKAVVQPMEMPDDPEQLEADLIALCRSRLADMKCPRSIDFRSQLPRAETGKLYKRQLKEEYAEKAKAAG